MADDLSDFNRKVIDEFRANDGAVTGPFAGAPMVLLTTAGAKTGIERIWRARRQRFAAEDAVGISPR